MPFANDSEATKEIGSDILMRTWEAFQSNSSKVFNTEDILISPSKKTFVEIATHVRRLEKQIDNLPQVFLAEFKSKAFDYTLQTSAFPEFQRERMRRYRSPFILNNMVTSIGDKYQAILAIDIAYALINTFQESHDMCAQNLLNMHLAEEVKDALPEVILSAVLSLTVHSEKPFYDKPAFFTILLN